MDRVLVNTGLEILSEEPKPLSRRELRKVVMAVGVGNYLEYFDWGLYGFFAPTIGTQFFPGEDPAIQLLSVLGVFAVGFFFRPIGGLVLGSMGDRLGRRAALSMSLIIMGAATTAIGLLPTYAQIGLWAPILLVTFRCVMGFSTGGEFTSSMTLLLESVPASRRGRYGSLQPIVSALALITASLLALWLTLSLDEAKLTAWGWRVPFIAAAALTAFGLWLRLRLEDSPVFQMLESSNELDERSVWYKLTANVKPISVVIAVTAVQGVGYYYLATYAVNFLSVNLGVAREASLIISLMILAGYAIMCFFAGLLLDRLGRRSVQLVGTLGFVVLTIPAFLLVSTGQFVWISLGLLLLAACQSLTVTSMALIVVEMFPSRSRSTGSAAGVNLGIVLIAGPGPYIANWLVVVSGEPMAAAFYLFAVALIAFPIMFKWLPETRGRDLASLAGAMEERKRATVAN